MTDVYESVLCMKQEVFVYRIPPRTTNRGYRAAEWKLDEPDWTGRLKVISRNRDISIKLEDKTTGELFAICPLESYPSDAVEQVLDSSRYFVVRIQDKGRNAFIGLGFADRADSFDLLVAIQDHFKHVKRDDQQIIDTATSELDSPQTASAKIDLSFKEGQTIKLNFPTKKSGEMDAPKSRPKGAPTSFLPPPPGGSKVTPSAAPMKALTPNHVPPHHSNTDLLLNISPTGESVPPAAAWNQSSGISSKTVDNLKPSAKDTSTNWVNFD